MRVDATLGQNKLPIHDATRELPGSVCHITTQFDPPATIRLESSYRIRGDSEIMQQMKTRRDAQPRGEDLAWAQGLFREFLALP